MRDAESLPAKATLPDHVDVRAAGLSAGWVTLNVDGQALPMYRAQPAGASNLPVVLLASAASGARAHLAEAARRFARLGYLALAPDLCARLSGPASGAATADAQVLADLDATVAWARANGGNPGKIAITGLAGGDRLTWLYAAHNPSIKAGAAWYSRPKDGVHVLPGGLSLALAL